MTSLEDHDSVRAIDWRGDRLLLLDQRLLPSREVWVECMDAESVAEAIAALVVRGAPAIGVAAAYGLVLAARQLAHAGRTVDTSALAPARARLAASRPTAVNLFNALARMDAVLERPGIGVEPAAVVDALDAEARAIDAEDLAANRRMGQLGAALIDPGSGVLTHCNTGSLATAGFGTALGVIRAGYAAGRVREVYACETRPWLQGARLTMWELLRDGIPARLIADSAGAHLMACGKVRWLIVGADRICANGDTANKIGTRQLAIAARFHGVSVMVVAPTSTLDFGTASGDAIEIELRDGRELAELAATRTAAPGAEAWNPVFDVTPAALIDAVVTERGVVERPTAAALRAAFA
jgi:methylthioribose-1-phosphate isomerase